jgi:hypothetical protein
MKKKIEDDWEGLARREQMVAQRLSGYPNLSFFL